MFQDEAYIIRVEENDDVMIMSARDSRKFHWKVLMLNSSVYGTRKSVRYILQLALWICHYVGSEGFL